MREDDIRIFLQEMSKHHFNEDEVINELESVNSDLVKARLAIPPQMIVLQDLQHLNAEAKERGSRPSALLPPSTFPISSNNGHGPGVHVRNGHVR